MSIEGENSAAVVEESVSSNNFDASNYVEKGRVTELIKEAKAKGYDRGRGESLGDIEERVRRAAKEEALKIVETLKESEQNKRMEEEAGQVVRQFATRLQETAKSGKYQDFEESISDLNVANMSRLVQESLKHDNTGEIIYELSKQPEKLQLLENLAHAQPQIAAKKIAELSKSLKQRDNASSEKVHEPLSKESTGVAAKGTNQLSMSELMRMGMLASRGKH